MIPDLLANVVWDFAYRNWALISILTTLTLLIVLPTVVLRKYIRVVLNILEDTPPPLAMGVVDYPLVEGEPISLRAFDGHALAGRIHKAQEDQPRQGLIIFAHEYAYNSYSSIRYCAALLKAGYDVLAFDFRGHGRSSCEEGYKPRQWASDREVADMLGAIAFAEEYLEASGRPRELGLFGISRGGAAAILAAVDTPSVKGIVTDGAFCTDCTLEYLMKKWATIFARVRAVAENHPPVFWRFLRWLILRNSMQRFNCRFPSVRKSIVRLRRKPLFLIHGLKDGSIPSSQSQMLYDMAAGPKYLWLVRGAKHNQSVVVDPEAYADRIIRFFDEHLAGDVQNPLPTGLLSDVAQPLGEPVAAPGRPKQARPKVAPSKN